MVTILGIGSCSREPDFQIPERCYEVAGQKLQLHINDTVQMPWARTEYWNAGASTDGTWVISMDNEKYDVNFHRGVPPFTVEELSRYTNEEWKREIELRASISLKNGTKDGRLWFFVTRKDGTQLQLGDLPPEIIDGTVTFAVTTLDGCDMLKVDLYCLMGDDSHRYEINVSYYYPYHFK